MVISTIVIGYHGDQQCRFRDRFPWRSAAWLPGDHVFSEHERELETLEQEVTDAFTGRDAGAERQQEDVPEKYTGNQAS